MNFHDDSTEVARERLLFLGLAVTKVASTFEPEQERLRKVYGV